MEPSENNTVRICHLSDFHLPLPAGVPLLGLAGKRLLGWANLTFRRSGTHKLEAFEALLEHLAAEDADMVVASLFTRYGLYSEMTLVIPGNHDRYTPGARAGAPDEARVGGAR